MCLHACMSVSACVHECVCMRACVCVCVRAHTRAPGNCLGLFCGCVESVTQLCQTVTQWTVAHQAPLSMGFSRQGYWSGWPCPFPGDLPNLGIEPVAPTLQVDSLPSEPPGKPLWVAVTECNRLDTNIYLSQFWRLEVQDPGSHRLVW